MPLTVASGDTRTIPSGETLYSVETDLSGELNVAGELQTADATVSATGQADGGTGTATATPQAQVSASGEARAIGFYADFETLTVDNGDTFSVSSGDVTTAGEVNLSGEIDLSGELQTRRARTRALVQRLSSASGVGEATGTATATPQKQASASGEAEAVGSATAFVLIPLVRGDSPDIEYHEDDDIDLGADSGGSL